MTGGPATPPAPGHRSCYHRVRSGHGPQGDRGGAGMSGDRTVEVRAEDAFDVAAVHAWLASRVPGLGDAPPSVRQFPGGASNLTYLLGYPDRELILRRPPAGHKAASAHDMRREFRVQQALRPVFPYVPEMLAFGDFLDGDFYVMERLDGLILRGN